MADFIHVGFGNMVNAAHIDAVVAPDGAPVKRIVQTAKENGTAIDASSGRRTRSVIFLENGRVVLSALMPETIAGRAMGRTAEGSEWEPSREEDFSSDEKGEQDE
ncbi:MAG: DUF370 domain-containing protein [Lachnospiraceae bacterium]|nr:DUF370 domain-containing protein [Lachnospiraceae bacterium]MCR5476157.1 DUF370 domain-containing protein [Lachnospiraceae bacterium]